MSKLFVLALFVGALSIPLRDEETVCQPGTVYSQEVVTHQQIVSMTLSFTTCRAVAEERVNLFFPWHVIKTRGDADASVNGVQVTSPDDSPCVDRATANNRSGKLRCSLGALRAGDIVYLTIYYVVDNPGGPFPLQLRWHNALGPPTGDAVFHVTAV